MADNSFEYNAPQICRNLKDVEETDEGLDSFFDVSDEVRGEKPKKKDLSDEVRGEKPEKKDLSGVPEINEDSESEKENRDIRKDQIEINKSLDSLSLETKEEMTVLVTGKEHNMLTRKDIANLTPNFSIELRSRKVLRQSFGERSKRKGSPLGGMSKFVSMAELVYNFEKLTPPRFRTTAPRSKDKVEKPVNKEKEVVTIPLTVTQSPVLTCIDRARPTDVLPFEERELKNIEELKQNKVKPTILNTKIFDPPKKINHEVKITVPKPFNLSETQKKEVKKDESHFVFKALPVPKSNSLFNAPRRNKEVPSHLAGGINDSAGFQGCPEGQRQKKLEIKPFSFDEKDKERLQKKEERIKQILEEEKKAREFHARPAPSFITGGHDRSIGCFSTCSKSSFASPGNSSIYTHDKFEVKPFKANPATVVHKKPFVVKQSERPAVKINEFQLHTKQRAQEREEFNRHLKKKEEEKNSCFKELAKIKEQEEDEKLKEHRKKLVHKPLPLPSSMLSKKEENAPE